MLDAYMPNAQLWGGAASLSALNYSVAKSGETTWQFVTEIDLQLDKDMDT